MGRHNKIDWPVEDMIRWYAEGMSLREIGKRLGRHFCVVRKVLQRHGVEMRWPGYHSYTAEHPPRRKERRRDKWGYFHVLCPDHPWADRCGYVREDRLVVEKILGRYLGLTEWVRHENRDPSDIRPENLVVWGMYDPDILSRCFEKDPELTAEEVRRHVQVVWRHPKAAPILGPSKSGGDQSPQMSTHPTG